MILIKNVGTRDVVYQDNYLNGGSVRLKGQELLENYEEIKADLTFPILQPGLDAFSGQLKKIYFFVTNQSDEIKRDSDTLFFGALMKRWIEERYSFKVEVFQYTANPANVEQALDYFTSKMTEKNSIFTKEEKKIVILSGGTSQMKMGLHLIFSSLSSINVEFYNVVDGKLDPVEQKQTLTKFFMKHTCAQLLHIHEYQAILELLRINGFIHEEILIALLEHAHHRRNFDFEVAIKRLDRFKEMVPSSLLADYSFLSIFDSKDPLFLIKELVYNLDIAHKNQNYLFFTGLLFRLEEALLKEIVVFFYREKLNITLKKKQDHKKLLEFLQNDEKQLWEWLNDIKFKGRPLKFERDFLKRPVLFYIAYKNEQEAPTGIIRGLLEIFDIINKYLYDDLEIEEREKKYGHPTDTACLGDLRNQSILAHGFEPVSKQKIEKLYKAGKIPIITIIETLLNVIEKAMRIITNDASFSFANIYAKLNDFLLDLILRL